MYITVSNYVVYVSVNKDSVPSLSLAKSAGEYFVNKLKPAGEMTRTKLNSMYGN